MVKCAAVATVALAALAEVAQGHCKDCHMALPFFRLTHHRHLPTTDCQRCQGRCLPEHQACTKQLTRDRPKRPQPALQCQRRQRWLHLHCLSRCRIKRHFHCRPSCVPPGPRILLHAEGLFRSIQRWIWRLVQDQGDRSQLLQRPGRLGHVKYGFSMLCT